MTRDDPSIAAKLREINDELLLLTTQRDEIQKVNGTDLDPDFITAQLVDWVHNLAGLLESQDVEDQRKVLFAFCKRITADAVAREIEIETDFTGLAQAS